MSDPPASASVDSINGTPVAIHWIQTLELGYESGNQTVATDADHHNNPVCFRCGKSDGNLSKCAHCVARYCSKECQVEDWKAIGKGGGGHKLACPSYARLQVVTAASPSDNNNAISAALIQIKPEARSTVCNEVYGRIRIYACSYAVHKSAALGRGFLFLQSDSTLANMSTPHPKDGYGYPIRQPRSILMHFLTLGEYDAEVCRDDFEMAVVRSKLKEAIAEYDEQTQLVLLMRFRCGHVALGRATLVPDHKICKVLGLQYFADSPAGAVQLNLDDI